MDNEYYQELVKVRIERARELLNEASELIEKNAYKSANNRAYYAIEKAVKALLALQKTDVGTHNGVLKQFNFLFIHNGDGTFSTDDYKIIAEAEQIRNASDYDDFYLASKSETVELVKNTSYLIEKIVKYIQSSSDK